MISRHCTKVFERCWIAASCHHQSKPTKILVRTCRPGYTLEIPLEMPIGLAKNCGLGCITVASCSGQTVGYLSLAHCDRTRGHSWGRIDSDKRLATLMYNVLIRSFYGRHDRLRSRTRSPHLHYHHPLLSNFSPASTLFAPYIPAMSPRSFICTCTSLRYSSASCTFFICTPTFSARAIA